MGLRITLSVDNPIGQISRAIGTRRQIPDTVTILRSCLRITCVWILAREGCSIFLQLRHPSWLKPAACFSSLDETTTRINR
jgi:hypothetical protein